MTDPIEFAYYTDRFMRLIHTRLHKRAVVVDTERVGPFGGLIMMALRELEPIAIQDLVIYMGRDKSQMTRAIQTLEQKGFVERRISPNDKRVSLLELTEKGHHLVSEFTEIIGDVITELTEPLSACEKDTLLALLKKI